MKNILLSAFLTFSSIAPLSNTAHASELPLPSDSWVCHYSVHGTPIHREFYITEVACPPSSFSIDPLLHDHSNTDDPNLSDNIRECTVQIIGGPVVY